MDHIFDIVSNNINMKSEVDRLIKMSQQEDVIDYYGEYYSGEELTLFEFVDKYCFNTWEYRNHCVDVSDYLKELKYETVKQKAYSESESLLIMIELIYNFWMLVE